jgi:hypothetical protein
MPREPLSPFAVLPRTLVLASAMTWSAVGIGLAGAGLAWTLRSAASGSAAAGSLALAGAVGLAKGRWVLAPRATANVRRIAGASGRRPIVSFFSPLAWGLVAAMMALGWVLRHSGVPKDVLGPVYAAVGSALLVGALPTWRAWGRMRGSTEGGA